MVTLHALVILEVIRGDTSFAFFFVIELLTIGDSIRDLMTRVSRLIQIVSSFACMAFIREIFVDITVINFSDWGAFVKVIHDMESVEQFGGASYTGISLRMEGFTVLGSVLNAVSFHVEVARETSQTNVTDRRVFLTVVDIIRETVFSMMVEVVLTCDALIE
jgi:hypothetical protein